MRLLLTVPEAMNELRVSRSKVYDLIRALRRARVKHRASSSGRPLPDDGGLDGGGLVVARWRYAGRGYTRGEALLAADLVRGDRADTASEGGRDGA